MRIFDKSEVYKSLGSGFKAWAEAFYDHIATSEDAFQYPWTERFEASRFGSLMRAKAETFLTSQVDSWMSTEPTLAYVITQITDVFTVANTTTQCAELFKTQKANGTSWHDHYFVC